MKNQELTINWHITEACNYSCHYCFAKWNKNGKEILHSSDSIEALMREITKLPMLFNQYRGTDFNSIRLNLVGGEPLLYREQMIQIIRVARHHGFTLSMVSNGSLLDDEWCKIIANNFQSIGISIDSIDTKTNLSIGRHTKNHVMSSEKVLRNIEIVRKQNPNIGIKINTVVNQLNYQESLHSLIEKINPYKWKIFKMLPIVTDNLSITDDQFQLFLENHRALSHLIYSEDNDEMVDSYVMIDSFGRFFQNSLQKCSGYQYSQPIYLIGIEAALQEIFVDAQKYQQRYFALHQKPAPTEKVV
jgi:radical SAM domain protein